MATMRFGLHSWLREIRRFLLTGLLACLALGAGAQQSNLENPQPGRTISGLGLISGWACSASVVEVSFNGSTTRTRVPTGGSRNDTVGVCGRSDTGFGLLFNFNLLGSGSHTLQLYLDGVPAGEPKTFQVATLGSEFLVGVQGSFTLPGFPVSGMNTLVEWRESQQNFAIVGMTPSSPSAFVLTSEAGSEGGAMGSEYTCDGQGSSPALTWANAPSTTQSFAVVMTTIPADGSTKYNWLLYDIPASRTGLARNAFGVGTIGVGSDGPFVGYQAPCSQGTGAKSYTFTLYALSGRPAVSAASGAVDGATLLGALAPITLARATLNLTHTRTAAATGSSAACTLVRNSVQASTSGAAAVSCDGTYAYISSQALPTHTMMDGITATNLQVPTAQNFLGGNGWKIPLNPAIASTTVSAVDGPIGVAINGVPIFNPCKQGGCQNGDTKALGELDVCNGHAGRADDYHYHAAPVCLMAGRPASYWDVHPIGWALDGFAIFGYNDPSGAVAARDGICGGNAGAVTNGPSGYSYHVTDVSPYILSCFRGTPSPDLAGQSAKYSPMRQPPVTPFAVSNMTLRTDVSDGFQVLQFTSTRTFVTTENGSDSYSNSPGSYQVRYKAMTGSELEAQLALATNRGKSACWQFQFRNTAGATTQPAVVYCR